MKRSGPATYWLFIWLCGFCIAADSSANPKPNILWITSEDNSISWVSCYGSENVKTPAIDQLAREGFRYTHCFSNAAVCAPTRSTWITGMYAVSNGTQPMRSRNDIPHDKIPYYPDLLKKAGYHVSNHTKTDFNIGGRPDKACWDEAKKRYGWRYRKEGQPFFSIMNYTESHESRAHGDVEGTTSDPAKMKLHAYHPDLPDIRKTYAKYADAVMRMDQDVKKAMDALKEDGLYEDTIIIYCSDHGGVLARSKRFLYPSGTHCPLIVRIPEKWKHLYPAEKPGEAVDRIVGFVDMPKTWLSLAGAEIPETFQGKIFLGKDAEPAPQYHFSFRARADLRLDCVRMMRDHQYSYIKNYMPYVPSGQFLAYLWRAKATQAWEQHHLDGKTNEITGRFFRPRPSEEFYDTVEDFDCVRNLIDAPSQQEKIAELKQALRKKQLELYDSGLLPEMMRLRRAQANNMTVYEMVRDPKLYPLETYLDAADLALERKSENLTKLIEKMKHQDEGMRWWAVVGLHLLAEKAAPAKKVLLEALGDECQEVRMMAAWTLVNLGEKEQALDSLEKLLFGECENVPLLHNILDWMGEPAFPLVKKYVAKAGKGHKKYKFSILGRVAELNGL
jgi:N-sulfoglucosamine sulfohydrolase